MMSEIKKLSILFKAMVNNYHTLASCGKTSNW